MLKGPRETSGAGAIRPLNLPEPVEVEEDGHQRPVALILRGRKLNITFIEDLWEIAEEWWRPAPIARRYYVVATHDGRRITLFRDLVGGGWYQQRG